MFNLRTVAVVVGDSEIKKVKDNFHVLKCKVITENAKGEVTPAVDLDITGSADKITVFAQKDISSDRVLDITNAEVQITKSKYEGKESKMSFVTITAKVDDVRVIYTSSAIQPDVVPASKKDLAF